VETAFVAISAIRAPLKINNLFVFNAGRKFDSPSRHQNRLKTSTASWHCSSNEGALMTAL
jgi:hypothetical protein